VECRLKLFTLLGTVVYGELEIGGNRWGMEEEGGRHKNKFSFSILTDFSR
jgi:hypothetical protein